ncbi:MAG: DNA alkylation repair protein [Deltaproteobacteria bacterium]|nr:DNA alkylation repair protein [Deltaproteobacteria bacterium]
MIVGQIRKNLRKIGDKERAETSQRFFKTGPGEYAEGDLFLGIRVPELRKLAKVYEHITLTETTELLQSAIHEERLLALFIIIRRYAKGTEVEQKKIYGFYLKNIRFVNNWDLVDTSAEHIVGAFLKDKPRELLYKLAKSKRLWERRIAIISTFHYIKRDEFSETLKISGMLLADEEDLIHKAVGWMLREVGKRDLETEETFLRKHYRIMPRTMLRYAIEKFPESKRQRYLKGTIRQNDAERF